MEVAEQVTELQPEQVAEQMTALVTELMTEQRVRWQLLTVELSALTPGPPTPGPPFLHLLTQKQQFQDSLTPG